MKITLVPFSPVLPAVVLLRYKSDTSADTFSWCSDLACMICCFTDTVDGLFVISKSALLTSRKSVFIINSVPTPSVEIASIVPSISSTNRLTIGSLSQVPWTPLSVEFFSRSKGSNIFSIKEGLIPHPICIVQSAIAPKTTQSVIQNPYCHGVSPPSVQMFLFNNSSSNLNCEVTEQLHYFFRFIPS